MQHRSLISTRRKLRNKMAEFGISWRWALIAPIITATLLLYFPELGQQALSLLGLTATHKFTHQPSVEIAQGTIVGRLVDDGTFPEPLEGFLGIPYALPPVGDLRFRPAVPVPESNHTIEAFYLGPRCVSLFLPLSRSAMSNNFQMSWKTTCPIHRRRMARPRLRRRILPYNIDIPPQEP